ncbi:Uncharacterized protein HZ326_29576 [Fusarium oxysporum f. sp. albedinis]|nr:Uncharacterized protein HZ326_29576 [Fusarium oxysporum f. sp. albedinis]
MSHILDPIPNIGIATNIAVQTYKLSAGERNEGTSRLCHIPKGKRANDENDDDGSERRPKAQRANWPSDILMLAFPYFKHDPRKYGRPKLKSCAHPGYRDVHRVKQVYFHDQTPRNLTYSNRERVCHRHKLQEYQFGRCRQDLISNDALEDGLSHEQVKRMRGKKLTYLSHHKTLV